MIAFACSVSDPEPYRRYAEPGIRLAAEPDSAIFSYASVGTIGRSYNVLLDAAAAHEDLEALVIVHPHAEIADPELCEKSRHALRDPDVAVLGFAGATGVRSIAWWDGEISCGPVIHRYTDRRGGDMRGYAWTTTTPAPAEVEAVDRFLLVLSPWATRNVRFDEGLMLHHGFEVDYCLQVRAAGKKVMTAEFQVIQHRPLEVVEDVELWVEAHIKMAEKWEGRMPGREVKTTDWKARARRAEAERESTRALAYSKRLAMDARVQALERQLQRTTETRSWRLTEPLRRVNHWRRIRAERRANAQPSPP
jgi:hypothetical protein